MICDDSVVIRGALARMLESDPAIRIVARVANGQLAIDELARQIAARQRIDVVVLDIEMPVMDGLTALPLLLRADPGLKIIVASSLTTRGAEVALRALRLGAADCLPKPTASGMAAPAGFGDDGFRRELIAKVRGLARLRAIAYRPQVASAPRQAPPRRAARRTAIAAAAACRRGVHRWPAGLVHPVSEFGYQPARSRGPDPAHAGQFHVDPGRSHRQARLSTDPP